jgi:DNA-binding MarR family transcriptional regulator
MPNEVSKELMDSFRRIVQALRSSHRAAGDLNLTGAQLFVLATLTEANGPLSIGELAERTRTDQSTVSVVAGRLVQRGLVRRKRSQSDSRRAELTLTPRGRALQKQAPGTVAQMALAEALEQLSARDAATLTRLLEQIVNVMGVAEAPVEMLFDDTSAPPPKRLRGSESRQAVLADPAARPAKKPARSRKMTNPDEPSRTRSSR